MVSQARSDPATTVVQANHEPDPETEAEPEPDKGGKRKRSKLLELTNEEQNEVADWYRDNEFLYNKGQYFYIFGNKGN